MEKGTKNIAVYINENTQEMNVCISYEIPHSELYLKISVQHLLVIDNGNWEGLHEPGGQLAGSYLKGRIPGGGPARRPGSWIQILELIADWAGGDFFTFTFTF